MMTVLLYNAKDKMNIELGLPSSADCLASELVYADDTLLLDTDPDILYHFMTCIGEAGSQYGLSFNWSKLELLPVRTSATICTPAGERIEEKTSMVYLGSA